MHIITNKISISERESKLWLASNQYMSGEISLQMLEAIERNYALTPTIAAAKLSSPKKNLLSTLIKKILLLLKREK